MSNIQRPIITLLRSFVETCSNSIKTSKKLGIYHCRALILPYFCFPICRVFSWTCRSCNARRARRARGPRCSVNAVGTCCTRRAFVTAGSRSTCCTRRAGCPVRTYRSSRSRRTVGARTTARSRCARRAGCSCYSRKRIYRTYGTIAPAATAVATSQKFRY